MSKPVTRGVDKLPSLKEWVYERIREFVVDGTLEFGQHLPETDLAERLGVSRGPVREALHLLERDGWVELRPRHGAYVRKPSVREIDHFFDVKRMLEGEAARLCATNATRKKVDELRELLVVADQAIERNDAGTLTDTNTKFHMAIATMSGNGVLYDLLERLEKQLRFYFALMSGLRNRAAWDEHNALVDAVVAGDPLKAALIMREHSDATRDAYHERRRLFERSGTDPAGPS